MRISFFAMSPYTIRSKELEFGLHFSGFLVSGEEISCILASRLPYMRGFRVWATVSMQLDCSINVDRSLVQVAEINKLFLVIKQQ